MKRSPIVRSNHLGLVVLMTVIFLFGCRLVGLPGSGNEEPTVVPAAENDSTLAITPKIAIEPTADADDAAATASEVNAGPELDESPDELSSSSRIETLSLADLNTDIPDDILREVSFGGGGGGGAECGETFADNNRQDEVIDDGYISIDTCYWDAEEIVQLTVLSPDGEVLASETKVATIVLDTGTVSTYYLYDPLEIELGRPYVFQFESQTKSATIEVTLIPAGSPVKGFSKDTTVFYNFRPGESVDVFYYEAFDRGEVNDPLIQCGLSSQVGFDLKGRQSYQADENGRVILGITQDSRFEGGQPNYYEADHYLAAVGEQSGEAIDAFASGREQGFIVARQSLAEREELERACYAGHEAADELIESLADFLGAAIESEIAAYRYSDPQLAADYYAGDVYENIRTSIATLDANNAYAISTFDFANSYYINERSSVYEEYYDGAVRGIRTSVWVDSCELWRTSYYSKADDRLLQSEPTRLLPQSIRIDMTAQGLWRIGQVNFRDPPAFCTDIDPDLYVVQ